MANARFMFPRYTDKVAIMDGREWGGSNPKNTTPLKNLTNMPTHKPAGLNEQDSFYTFSFVMNVFGKNPITGNDPAVNYFSFTNVNVRLADVTVTVYPEFECFPLIDATTYGLSDLVRFQRDSDAWYFDRDGKLARAVAGEPVFDHKQDRGSNSDAGEFLGLRAEPATTNRIKQSRKINGSKWRGLSEFDTVEPATGIDGVDGSAIKLTSRFGNHDFYFQLIDSVNSEIDEFSTTIVGAWDLNEIGSSPDNTTDVSSQTTAPRSGSWEIETNTFVHAEDGTNTIYEYAGSSFDPFDFSQATFNNSGNLSNNTSITDIKHSWDGERIYACDDNDSEIHQYTIVPGSAATSAQFEKAVQPPGNLNPAHMIWKPDGSKLYISDGVFQNRVIEEFDAAVPFDVGSLSKNGEIDFANVSGHSMDQINNFDFAPNGEWVIIEDRDNRTLYQFVLTIPWDITSPPESNALDTTFDYSGSGVSSSGGLILGKGFFPPKQTIPGVETGTQVGSAFIRKDDNNGIDSDEIGVRFGFAGSTAQAGQFPGWVRAVAVFDQLSQSDEDFYILAIGDRLSASESIIIDQCQVEKISSGAVANSVSNASSPIITGDNEVTRAQDFIEVQDVGSLNLRHPEDNVLYLNANVLNDKLENQVIAQIDFNDDNRITFRRDPGASDQLAVIAGGQVLASYGNDYAPKEVGTKNRIVIQTSATSSAATQEGNSPQIDQHPTDLFLPANNARVGTNYNNTAPSHCWVKSFYIWNHGNVSSFSLLELENLSSTDRPIQFASTPLETSGEVEIQQPRTGESDGRSGLATNIIALSNDQPVKSIKVDVENISSLEGKRLQIGHMEVGQIYQPTFNLAPDFQQGFQSRTKSRRLISGARQFRRQPKDWVFRGSIELLPKDEVLENLWEMMRLYDIDTPFVFEFDPNDTSNSQRLTALVYFEELGLLSYPIPKGDRLSVPIRLVRAI